MEGRSFHGLRLTPLLRQTIVKSIQRQRESECSIGTGNSNVGCCFVENLTSQKLPKQLFRCCNWNAWQCSRIIND